MAVLILQRRLSQAMEKMDIHSRNEYLKVARARYYKVKRKKTKP